MEQTSGCLQHSFLLRVGLSPPLEEDDHNFAELSLKNPQGWRSCICILVSWDYRTHLGKQVFLLCPESPKLEFACSFFHCSFPSVSTENLSPLSSQLFFKQLWITLSVLNYQITLSVLFAKISHHSSVSLSSPLLTALQFPHIPLEQGIQYWTQYSGVTFPVPEWNTFPPSALHHILQHAVNLIYRESALLAHIAPSVQCTVQLFPAWTYLRGYSTSTCRICIY